MNEPLTPSTHLLLRRALTLLQFSSHPRYDHGRLGNDPSGNSRPGSSKSSTSPPKALRQSKKKKMQKIKVPTYSTKPLPVNSLVGVQTQGTVAELCTGERHTLVITTKGQVLAFGDNTKYALGSKQLMEGRNQGYGIVFRKIQENLGKFWKM